MEEILDEMPLSSEQKEKIIKVVEEQYPEKAKPIKVTNKEQFEEFMSELLKMLPEFKLADSRQKILTETCKKYMSDNNIKFAECKYGNLVFQIVHQRRLDRALIEDIDKYKTLQKGERLNKNPNEMAYNS